MGQYRVNLGNGGQNWQNGSPCTLHGLQFERDIQQEGVIDACSVLTSIGKLTEFTWLVVSSLQNEASDHPIAPDHKRFQRYAAHLNKYLHMSGRVPFEDLTLVVSSLYPVVNNVEPHRDVMNDTIAGYTRTAAFNMVMICEGSDKQSTMVIHFQLICNFRKVIGHYLVPFSKYLKPVADHAKQYLDKWHRSMQSIYTGKAEVIPTVFNRWAFFLDDTLEYKKLTISEEGKHKQTLVSHYLLSEIGVSRTLSFSMFIHNVVELQPWLRFDQTLELAFACSFLSNPFWFDWTMSSLLRRLRDPDDEFKLGLHPFYDWSETTIDIFGTWQGGPFNRWSPCRGKETIMHVFGAGLDATETQRKEGERKLSQVVSILYQHVEWINSLSGCGREPIVDMPLNIMKRKCEETVRAIAKVASCQFGQFRLGVMTTILSGCGLLKEGKHLRNLMYPVKGSASFKHLCCPVADYMSPGRAEALGNNENDVYISNDGEGFVDESQHDEFMQYLSCALGFQTYLRDEIECILCESHPMRNLSCRDWFRKGCAVFDCNENGEFFRRGYGRDTEWEKLHPPTGYKLAYVGKPLIRYVALDVMLAYHANDFGTDLRSLDAMPIRFKGRTSRTSGQQRTYSNNYSTVDTVNHPSMKMADFYMGKQAKSSRIRSMFVLGDAESAVEMKCCNNLENYPRGIVLLKHLSTMSLLAHGFTTPMAAGSYHMDSELNNDEIAFFPGHLDKPFVHTAWFVPLGTSSFFTIIAVAESWRQEQDLESLRSFEEWRGRLSTQDLKKVEDFYVTLMRKQQDTLGVITVSGLSI